MLLTPPAREFAPITDQLGEVLQAGRDIDRIADHGELRMALVADVACDDQAAVYPNAEADRIVLAGDERRVQPFDVGGDGGACRDRLPAGLRRPAAEAEQGEQPIAEDLVGLSARIRSPRD